MRKIGDWLKTWSVPQAIVASVALLCATALSIVVTVQDDWGRLFRWLSDPATSGLLLSLATLAGVLYHRALGLPADEAPVPSRPRPRRVDQPPPTVEGGFVDVRILYLVAAVGLTVLGCAVLPGCGASSLRQHATATVIATIAVESAEDMYLAHLDAAEGVCQDEPCVLAARESHRPAEVAIALTRTAVGVYRDAVELAVEADETPSLVSALLTAALRLAARWAVVVETLATIGVEVPALPIGGAP